MITSSRPERTASCTTSWIAGTSITGSDHLRLGFRGRQEARPLPGRGDHRRAHLHRAGESTVGAPVDSRGHAHLRVRLPGVRPRLRDRPEDERRSARDLPRVRRRAPEGLHAAGDRVQGVGLLRHRSRQAGEGRPRAASKDGRRQGRVQEAPPRRRARGILVLDPSSVPGDDETRGSSAPRESTGRRSASSAARGSTRSSTTPRRSRSRRRTGRRARRSRSGPWAGGAWRSCPGTAATTSSRRTRSRTARTSGG